MILKKLEINGFKSFDKKLSLDFNRRITGVVGPNGSGKSNILEAFRFALGEQSLKSMRGKKGEDLIFNGGNTGNRKNMASIKIFFDNSKNVFDAEFSEIVIERRVYRDGANDYLINDSPVRLKDVIEMLTKANITPRGNQIISQGQADWLLNTNPVNRKEIIEDSLGLKIFQYRKKESEKKLERTKNQIKEIGALRKEMQPHLRFLQKQAERIKKVKELKEQLLSAYEEYLPLENSYLMKEEASVNSVLAEASKKMERLERELAEKDTGVSNTSVKYKDEIATLKKELSEVNKNKNEALLLLGRMEGRKEAEKFEQSVSMEDFEKAEKEVMQIVDEGENTNEASALRLLLSRIKGVFERLRKREGKPDTDKEYNEQKNKLDSLKAKEMALNEKIAGLEAKQKEESEKTHTQEKEVFELKNEKVRVEGEKLRAEEKLKTILVEKRSFEDELDEGRVLVGHSINIFVDKKVEVSNFDNAAIDKKRRDIERMKIKIEELGTAGENSAELEKQYNDMIERDTELENEIKDLQSAMEGIEKMIDILVNDIDKKFKNGIVEINKHFSVYFKTLFGSGSAKISLVKELKRKKVIYDEKGEEIEIGDEDTQEGIDISISLPHKRIKSLDALSGGERALVSIALLFSLSQVMPPPFLILDETDAALDEANSKRYGDIIDRLAQESQLILITHNRETMSRANLLYGVTMSKEGASKVLSVKLSDAVSVAK